MSYTKEEHEAILKAALEVKEAEVVAKYSEQATADATRIQTLETENDGLKKQVKTAQDDVARSTFSAFCEKQAAAGKIAPKETAGLIQVYMDLPEASRPAFQTSIEARERIVTFGEQQTSGGDQGNPAAGVITEADKAAGHDEATVKKFADKKAFSLIG